MADSPAANFQPSILIIGGKFVDNFLVYHEVHEGHEEEKKGGRFVFKSSCLW